MRTLVVVLALVAEFALGFLAGHQHAAPTKLIPPVQLKDVPRAADSAASRDLNRAWLSFGSPLSLPQGMIPDLPPSVTPSSSALATPTTSPSAPVPRKVAAVSSVGVEDLPRTQTAKTYAQSKVSAVQWPCLDALWQHESGWNPTADNPTSTAYGIPQLLTETSADPQAQVDDGLAYIGARYGDSCSAWAFWQQNGWY